MIPSTPKGKFIATTFIAYPALLLLLSPLHASAQAYVPVKDIELNPAFATYSSNFDTYAAKFDQYIKTDTDSVQNLIAGGDPQGVAVQPCQRGDTFGLNAFAYTGPDQAWAKAASSSAGALPYQIPTGGGKVQVNTSGSVRCLLQEIVEWQKLGLSLEIHTLLKSYISDAQTKQLNNQLLNQIAAANLNWAKAGNQTVVNGIASNEPVYSTNRSQSEYNVKNRQLEHILDKASADPSSGNAVGSLGICEPWRLDTAADIARNNRAEVEDPSFFEEETTSCNLSSYIAPSDYGKFSESFNDPSNTLGGIATFKSILSNPGNSPLGASTAADAAARSRLVRQEESTRLDNANTGFKPTKACSGDSSDPYCLDQQNSIAITPAGQNQANITEVAQQGNQQVHDGTTLDATAGSSTETQSTKLNTESGLLGYDETGIATSQTAVNRLVQEFYDVIQIGYFAITTDTTQWAQATMLMIYDEMKFNDTAPQVVVTAGTAEVDTNY